jgi:hypothetical protein
VIFVAPAELRHDDLSLETVQVSEAKVHDLGMNHLNLLANGCSMNENGDMEVNVSRGGPERRLSIWCSPTPCRLHKEDEDDGLLPLWFRVSM